MPMSMNGASVSGATPVFSPFTGGATVPSSMHGTSTVTASFTGGNTVPSLGPVTSGASYAGLPPSQNTGSRYQLNPNAPAWTGIHHDNSGGGLLNNHTSRAATSVIGRHTDNQGGSICF